MARPRNTDSDAAILTAAAETLQRDGYDGLIVDELARAVGVAKTTVYRRWPTKNHLVVSVIAAWQGEVAVPDSGDTEADLVAIVTGMARALDPASMRRLVAELAAASARDADLRAQVELLWNARRAATAAILARGVADGTLRDDLDVEIAMDQLAGAVYYRVLITGAVLNDDFARTLVRSLLAGAR
jgi:AcrR family transcriptional regulator